MNATPCQAPPPHHPQPSQMALRNIDTNAPVQQKYNVKGRKRPHCWNGDSPHLLERALSISSGAGIVHIFWGGHYPYFMGRGEKGGGRKTKSPTTTMTRNRQEHRFPLGRTIVWLEIRGGWRGREKRGGGTPDLIYTPQASGLKAA